MSHKHITSYPFLQESAAEHLILSPRPNPPILDQRRVGDANRARGRGPGCYRIREIFKSNCSSKAQRFCGGTQHEWMQFLKSSSADTSLSHLYRNGVGRIVCHLWVVFLFAEGCRIRNFASYMMCATHTRTGNTVAPLLGGTTTCEAVIPFTFASRPMVTIGYGRKHVCVQNTRSIGAPTPLESAARTVFCPSFGG